MSSIWKHPNSQYWSACFTNAEGKQVKRSTKKTDRESARIIAIEWERAENQARSGSISTAQIQKVFNEVVEKTTGDNILSPSVKDFLNNWLEAKTAKSATATGERYAHTIRLFLTHLGDKAKMPLTAVRPIHIESFLTQRLKGTEVLKTIIGDSNTEAPPTPSVEIKRGAAPKTVIVDIKTLSTAFNRAYRLGIILSNPVLAVELPKNISSEREVFTHEQVKKLLETVGWKADWFTLILLGYCTGARLGDCASMKWANVDLGKGVISYVQQKTGTPVVVPLHRLLFDHLDTIWEFVPEFKTGGFLCPELAARNTGGKHGLSESFNRIVKRAGIDPQNVQGKGSRMFNRLTFHSLRHSFNSVLANAGVSPEVRMKLTGHTSMEMNRRYTHHNMEPLHAAIRMIPDSDENQPVE